MIIISNLPVPTQLWTIPLSSLNPQKIHLLNSTTRDLFGKQPRPHQF